MPDPDIWYIHMRTPKALVELELTDEHTSVYTGPVYKENTLIITLDYLADITPQTASEFANRILNMKVFL